MAPGGRQVPPPPRKPSAKAKPPALVAAPWLTGWRKEAKRRAPHPPTRNENSEAKLVTGMLQVYEAIMGKPPGKPVLPAAAKRVLAVWDKRASIQGQYVAWQDHVDDLVLLVDACHGCPAEMFARDIRAVGWDAGTDRSRDIKSVLQWKPDRGAGATFDERLDAAREWDAAGRPGTTEDNSREAILRRVSSGEWRGPVMTPEEIESERLENEKAAVALRALVANNNRETGGTA